jgi:hypothetical protein
MLGVIGAFFLVGLSVAMIVSVMNCSTIGIVQTFKYGSIWTLFPSLVFIATGDKYMAMLSVAIPTLFLISLIDDHVCKAINPKHK